MNFWDIIIIAGIVVIVVFSVIKIVKNLKKGKTSCGCDCSRCSGGCTRGR